VLERSVSTAKRAAMGSSLTRRRFLQAGAAGAVGASLLPAAGCGIDPGGDEAKYNVLLLIIDTVRPDHVGAYGAPVVQTPNLDALAARGLRFDRAFPEAMVTGPARRSIFTSKRIFPFRNHVPHPDLSPLPGWAPITDNEHTWTALLRDAGYFVAQVSDNPHTAHPRSYGPFRLSYDRFASVVGVVAGTEGELKPAESVPLSTVHKWLPPVLRTEASVPKMRSYLANSGEGVDEELACCARVFKEAANMLDDVNGREPFALVVDCFDPHEPWAPPRKYLDLYGDPDYEGPEIGLTNYGLSGYLSREQLRRLRAIYAAELTMTDRWLGHFMDRFYELGLHANTVVLLLSDHGYLLGDRGYVGKVPSETHPELAQVPFIIVHPEGKAAGEAASYFASTHDVGPTLMAMVGVDPPDHLEGVDLSPLLDRKQPREKRDFHYGGVYNSFYIRTDDWCLIADNRGGSRKLYDLASDPSEINNVVDRHPKLAEELYQQVLQSAGGPLPFYTREDLGLVFTLAPERKREPRAPALRR
jgi:arylsulfatase A-like enzyme